MKQGLKRFFTILTGLFILYCLIGFALLPTVIERVVSSWLAERGARVTHIEMGLNPLRFDAWVKNLSIEHAQQSLFSLNQLNLELDVMALLDKRLVVEQLSLSGGELDLALNDGELSFAGLTIPAPNAASATKDSASPWTLEVGQLTLADSQINFSINGKPLPIELSSIVLEEVSVGDGQSQAKARLQLRQGEHRLNLNTSLNLAKSHYTQRLTLQQFNLSLPQLMPLIRHSLPASLDVSTGMAVISGELIIEQPSEKAWSIRSDNLGLTLPVLALSQGNSAIEASEAQLTLSALKLHIGETLSAKALMDISASSANMLLASYDNTPPISVALVDIALQDLAIEHGARRNLSLKAGSIARVESTRAQAPLVKVTALKLNQIQVNQDNKLVAGALETGEVSLARRVETQQPLATVGHLRLTEINAAANALAVQRAEIGPLNGAIDFDEQGALRLPPALIFAADMAASSNANSDANAQATQPFRLMLDELTLAPESQMQITDASIAPAFSQTVRFDRLKVANLHTQAQAPEMVVEAHGSLVNQGDFAIGTVSQGLNVFDKAEIKVKLTSLSLLPISGYLNRALGYQIQSGQTDMQLQLTTQKGIANGKARFKIRGLSLGDQTLPAERSVLKDTSMPFNLAIQRLADNKGNLKVDVPITGKIDELEFGVGGFIALLTKKALMESAKHYLLTTFVPYSNIVNVVMAIGEEALKVRIRDLEYTQGQIIPEAAQREFAREFTGLLNRYDDTQVRVCPKVTPQESDRKGTLEDNQQALHKLGLERGEAFIVLLRQEFGIAGARLIPCAPEVTAKGKPSLSFEIR